MKNYSLAKIKDREARILEGISLEKRIYKALVGLDPLADLSYLCRMFGQSRVVSIMRGPLSCGWSYSSLFVLGVKAWADTLEGGV
jgi:hypothetical protein